ncbi:sigma-70 family RNA polymerase sigma factor [Advenella mimigardefordensis]|uniref:RNA polymerase sigma factor n=1 Tax=Advenella mimigardefordensis (strain DSM 17166 / LMG 22922 / DPN7) TaxID=1247726 RepID=W0P6X6_ADVMD|nr:sigma-70 family RNA polymerase sigma factor [Advenella mimigardefordensis]AHG62511.1 RNA polymerase sigma factor [Advenella mimigardefordensis DPN7]
MPEIDGEGTITDDISDASLRALLPRLYRFALWLSKDPNAADDLVQASIERALKYQHTRRPEGDLRAWLFSILYRQFIDSKRHAKRYARLLEWFRKTDEAPSTERHVQARASLQAFEQLPEAQRTLLWLVSVDGLSYKAVADMFDVPLGTIMSRLSRARGALRDASDGESRPHLRILK